jgi:hypothetical protein
MSASLNDKLEDFLKQHANEWVDGFNLALVAGRYAWRSRVSDLRRHRRMTIDNRVRTVVAHALGCAGMPRQCSGCANYKVSEYRYVPDLPTRVEPSGQQAFI